ncbi:MAG: Na+/H+ antiporter NhaA [Legionella sp.]|uniref:Na+/H+ antiporter NhaA n=1 Tax=Legionella sp. TaxID=459 RepID=UPI0039E44D1F
MRLSSSSFSSGILLFIAAVLAVFVANSPFRIAYDHFFNIKGTLGGMELYACEHQEHKTRRDGLLKADPTYCNYCNP